MATTPEEILAKGKGPVQKTWVDQPAQHVSPTTSQRPETSDEPTGVENVKHDTVTAQGAPNNPHSPRDVVERGVVNDGALAPKVASKPKEGFYTRWFRAISPYQPPTKEELEKERKKQKRESIFAAISDGIAALSNLYFTSQYAPNAYDPSKGMSATTKARFDKLKKEREDKHRQYMEGFMRAMKWDADDARDERNWQHIIERDKVSDQYRDAADARAQAKADRDAAMAQLRMDLMQGKIDQQDAEAKAAKIEADYAEAYWQSRINKNNYRRPIGSGGSGKVPEYPWYDSDGNLHYSSSYEAMRQNAINNGTWSEATQESTTEREQKDRRGNTKGTSSSTTVKPAKGHSAKPESKKPNPMDVGGTGNGDKKKKKNPMS